MNRRQRRKSNTKFTKGMVTGLALVENIKKMIDAGAIEMYNEDYKAYLNTELFWNGKDLSHKTNFAKNLEVYFDVMNHKDAKQSPDQQTEIYDIDKGTLLATYAHQQLVIA